MSPWDRVKDPSWRKRAVLSSFTVDRRSGLPLTYRGMMFLTLVVVGIALGLSLAFNWW